ncbi:MAG: O-antigen ligase family protein [Bacteroidota bacterium]
MASKPSIWPKVAPAQLILFKAFALITLLSLFIGIATDFYYLFAAPALVLLLYISVVDIRSIFYLLLVCIPLSNELYLPGGLATDLPTEPLMFGLMLLYFLYIFNNAQNIDGRFFRHPITLLLFAHLIWIYVATMFSSELFVSIKFALAKTWYIVVFYFMGGLMLFKVKHFKTFFWLIFIPLITTIVIILLRHATEGFSFDKVNSILDPFYRNHVNYASIMALFVPFIWYARRWYPYRGSIWWYLMIGLLIVLIGIQFSFTRAAYVALFMAIGANWIIRSRLVRYVLAVSLVVALSFVGFMSYNNTYLDYAPNFERTVTHRDFGNLVGATAKGEDISTMERFYRWIAGVYMSGEKPVTGFGPGNFYNFYRSYTVTSFQTYVSDNPEKSGIHSYYLMTLTEQGFPGLFIFIVLLFYSLIKGEQIYHEAKDPDRRQIIMTVLLSMVIISALLLINDMIETDKVGSFFFIHLATLTNMDLAQKTADQA